MRCPACGTRGPEHHVRGLHLVARRFVSWSGMWTNTVVCDGTEVGGRPITSNIGRHYHSMKYHGQSSFLGALWTEELLARELGGCGPRVAGTTPGVKPVQHVSMRVGQT